jgi:hypothetical protein
MAVLAGCTSAVDTEAVASAHGGLSSAQLSILGFEAASDWTVTAGTKVQSTVRSAGAYSLGISGIGYSELQSPALSSLGPLAAAVNLDVRLPAAQPNPYWFGSVQMYVDCPSRGVYSASLGQVDLTGRPLGVFNHLSFQLPSTVRAQLSGATFTDLRVRIVLNVPQSSHQYQLDQLDFSGTVAAGQAAGTACALGGRCTVTVNLPHSLPDAQASFVASDTLTIGDRTRITSATSSLAAIANVGSGTTTIGPSAIVGDVWSRGKVEIRDQATVGFARTLQPVTVPGSSSLAGQSQLSDDLEPLRMWSWSIAVPNQPGTSFEQPPDTTASLSPGGYVSLSVKPRAHIKLQAGAYFFDTLFLDAQSVLELPEDGSAVSLYVLDSLTFRGTIQGVGASGRLLLAYLGSDPISIEAPFTGILVSPRSDLMLGAVTPSTYSGSFFARTLITQPGTTLALSPPLLLTVNTSDRVACVNALGSGAAPTDAIASKRLGYDLLVNCIAPGIPACEASMVASANMDRSGAAYRYMAKTFDTGDYLGLARDRTRKLNDARKDASRMTAYCLGDADGDLVADSLDTCPNTPPLTPTDDHGCPGQPKPIAVPREVVDGILATRGFLRNPRCDGYGEPAVPTLIRAGWTNAEPNQVRFHLHAGPAAPPGCEEWFELNLVDLKDGQNSKFVFRASESFEPPSNDETGRDLWFRVIGPFADKFRTDSTDDERNRRYLFSVRETTGAGQQSLSGTLTTIVIGLDS